MNRYFRIIQLATDKTNLFDAIREVADATGKAYYEIMLMMGFECNADLIEYCNGQFSPYFSKSEFVTRELNHICRELDASVRVARPQQTLARKEQRWIFQK